MRGSMAWFDEGFHTLIWLRRGHLKNGREQLISVCRNPTRMSAFQPTRPSMSAVMKVRSGVGPCRLPAEGRTAGPSMSAVMKVRSGVGPRSGRRSG
jgi:hypothetical protein